jgi:hypothetical protein
VARELRAEVERLRSWLPRRIVEQPLLFGTPGEPRHEVGFTEGMRTYCTTCSARHQDWVTPDECPQFAEMDVPARVVPAARAEAAEAESARLREAMQFELDNICLNGEGAFEAFERRDRLRAALASVGASGSADRREANASQAPDTATPGEAAQTENDWQSLLSMVWTGDTTYPFMEDENANITGYGHQDKAAFASAVNAYDEDCNGGPIPEEDQWSADSIAHQWVLPDADDERLHPVVEGTPDAIAVTTLWGQR